MSLISKIKNCFLKTKDKISQKLNQLFKKFRKVDEEFLKELLEILISSDVGIDASKRIIDIVRDLAKEKNIKNGDEVKNILKKTMVTILTEKKDRMSNDEIFPRVITVVGVNGVGKTTSIAKLASFYKNLGKKVLVAAGDTFRAAAANQLNVWADKVGVEIYSKDSKDPASIIYEAIVIFKEQSFDLLICDTAGRLHNQKNLMEELRKINKIIDKLNVDNETLIVIDATTGQNAISQVKSFREIINLNGIFLTKIDGSSKGGIIFAIKNEFDLDVKYVGSGETAEDLTVFDPEQFCENIF